MNDLEIITDYCNRKIEWYQLVLKYARKTTAIKEAKKQLRASIQLKEEPWE